MSLCVQTPWGRSAVPGQMPRTLQLMSVSSRSSSHRLYKDVLLLVITQQERTSSQIQGKRVASRSREVALPLPALETSPGALLHCSAPLLPSFASIPVLARRKCIQLSSRWRRRMEISHLPCARVSSLSFLGSSRLAEHLLELSRGCEQPP